MVRKSEKVGFKERKKLIAGESALKGREGVELSEQFHKWGVP